jgi:Na+/H+ antiporter NhaD/arsenite permease-like protein
MMIVVANLRLSGFFTLVSAWVVERAGRPLLLLAGLVLVSGVFSAFFVNDTMCLVLTPLVLEITARLRRNPVPYLLAVAMASNVGSVATITGNPQNMMIGSFSHIPYSVFAAKLAPIAAAGLVLTALVIALVYRKEFRREERLPIGHDPVRVDRPLLWKSLAVSAGMIAFFFAGSPVPKVAVVSGALLLLTRRVKPEKIYREIDWGLLVMFIGLFIVIAGVEKTHATTDLFARASQYHLERTAPMAIFAAILSNLVSNVPAVLVFKSFVPHLPDAARAWLNLAMSSTLAGNLTVLGSVANLIVVQKARHAVHISFWEYAKTGIPLTLLTIALGVWMLG